MKGFTLLIILKFKKQEAGRPVSEEEKERIEMRKENSYTIIMITKDAQHPKDTHTI